MIYLNLSILSLAGLELTLQKQDQLRHKTGKITLVGPSQMRVIFLLSVKIIVNDANCSLHLDSVSSI